MAKSVRKQSDMASSAARASPPRVTLTTEEVRQVYALTAAFLRRHPELPRYKCGHRTVVYRVSDIERYLAQRAVA
jgi:hypothetical protein